MPDVLAGTVILGLIVFMVYARQMPTLGDSTPKNYAHGHEAFHAEAGVPVPFKEALVTGMLTHALMPGVVIAIMLMRGARLGDLFGFAKVGFAKTLGLGVGLGLLAATLVNIAIRITQQFMRDEPPQMLIQKFQSAASGRNEELMIFIAVSAVVVAPIVEEFLFRGIFYPVVARGMGRVPSAVICALLFGLAHDTYAALPGLALLAVLFTLTYEAYGSLLVPMIMHITFNSLSLGVMVWLTYHGGK
jgi:membrane protease YdiL (CAAX protease family)